MAAPYLVINARCAVPTAPSDWSPVAQLVEQAAVNRLVASSSLARGAIFIKGLAL